MPTDLTKITIPAVGGGTVSAYVFIDGYRKGEGLREAPWREVIYQVAWSDSDLLMDSLLGGTSTTTIIPGGSYTRTVPHQFPGNANLYCVSVNMVDGLGVPRPDPKLLGYSDGQGGQGWCHVLARYEAPPFDVGGTETYMTPPGGNYAMPWTRWGIKGKTVIQQVPSGAIKGQTTGNNPTKSMPLRVHQEHITVTFYQVPFVFLDVYRSLAKHVNDAILFGWPPGCVLFDEYDFDGERSTNGSYVQNLTLTFLGQSVEWNKMLLDDDMGYELMQGTQNNLPPYPEGDLTATLR